MTVPRAHRTPPPSSSACASSASSSPLSALSSTPSPPASPWLPPPAVMGAVTPSRRYPSPSLSASSAPLSTTSSFSSLSSLSSFPNPLGIQTPLSLTLDDQGHHHYDSSPLFLRSDGPSPAKRRRVTIVPRPRTTENLDLQAAFDAPTPKTDELCARLAAALQRRKRILVIAGAGISVSAGVPDFRSGSGLFRSAGKHLFDASVYRNDRDTESFHEMVCRLAEISARAPATPFHHMLASLAHENRLLRLYSQNIDCIDTSLAPLATRVPLNRKGPWPKTIQVHGGIGHMTCTKCGQVRALDPAIFAGPEAPLCEACRQQDAVRTAFANKRSHGIGRLRPRIVLYNEYNPDEEAIGNVSQADLRRVPDVVLVVGTSLKIPGMRRLVREMCLQTRSRRDGFTAWINIDPEPQGGDFRDCFDLLVRGTSDDVANLVHLPRWDDQEDFGVTGTPVLSPAEDQLRRARLCRDRVEVRIPGSRPKREPAGRAGGDEEEDGEHEPAADTLTTPTGRKMQPKRLASAPKVAAACALLTPRASPRLDPRKNNLLKLTQGKLLFGGGGSTNNSKEGGKEQPQPVIAEKDAKPLTVGAIRKPTPKRPSSRRPAAKKKKKTTPASATNHAISEMFKASKNVLDPTASKKRKASDMDDPGLVDPPTARSSAPLVCLLPALRPPRGTAGR